ncbi:hypothetical protein [uncultured Sphingomonas sp.]|uniref:hypothetical protein n=1 Tax=uncultured Sphingomonas sp. TaxID=158754 RepID=UPI0025E0DEF6|nr:hypothetical protein [uncultured Sphingomonas sp.]
MTFGDPLRRCRSSRAAIAGAVHTGDLLGWGALPLGMSALYPALAIGFLLIASFGMWARQHVDGVSGDMHEAGIALSETCLLLFAAITIDWSGSREQHSMNRDCKCDDVSLRGAFQFGRGRE